MRHGEETEPVDLEDEALAVDCGTMVLDMDDDDDAVDPNCQDYCAAYALLSAIWGADAKGTLQGVHFVAEKMETGRGFLHHSRKTVGNAASLSLGRSAVGQNVYFACAMYATYNGTNKGNRTQSNAVGAYTLWLDIDCGAGKPYVDQAAGEAALKAFCVSAGIDEPSILVDSGNGLHCYWHFDQFVDKVSWTLHAKALSDLTQVHKFHVDPMRTNDIASVLRVPGTTNYKDRANLKLVTLRRAGPPLDYPQFVAALQTPIPPSPVAAQPAPPQGPSAANAQTYPPSSAHELVKHCATLAHFEAVGGAVSEPLWRFALGILKHTVEGEPLAHQWSMGDPRYNQTETQEKLDNWTKPPALCATIRTLPDAHCAGCTNMCRSPIQLGTAGRVAGYNFSDSHFVSRAGNSVLVFDEREPNILPSGMTFENFKNFHSNKLVGGKNAAGEWLKSAGRRTYDRLVFDPSGRSAPTDYNAWRGLAVDPKPGRIKRILRHIFEVWCDRDLAQFKYVLRWMALLVQRPWVKPEVALVLRSKEGTGKNIIVQALLDVFGPHGFITAQKDQVAGRFNGHLFDKVLVVLDEAFFAGDPAAVAAAKALITNPQIGYEPKGKDAFSARNYAHVVVMTNNAWAVPAGEDARRWAVLDVSGVRAGDLAYFRALAREIKNGGVEALLHFLMRVSLRGFNPRAVPNSHALHAQRMQTLSHTDPVAAWWLEVLIDGEFPLKHGSVDWDTEISSGEMQESYLIASARARQPPTFPVAARRLRRLVPVGALSRVRKGQPGDRYFSYQLPDLADARQRFKDVTGIDPCTP